MSPVPSTPGTLQILTTSPEIKFDNFITDFMEEQSIFWMMDDIKVIMSLLLPDLNYPLHPSLLQAGVLTPLEILSNADVIRKQLVSPLFLDVAKVGLCFYLISRLLTHRSQGDHESHIREGDRDFEIWKKADCYREPMDIPRLSTDESGQRVHLLGKHCNSRYIGMLTLSNFVGLELIINDLELLHCFFCNILGCYRPFEMDLEHYRPVRHKLLGMLRTLASNSLAFRKRLGELDLSGEAVYGSTPLPINELYVYPRLFSCITLTTRQPHEHQVLRICGVWESHMRTLIGYILLVLFVLSRLSFLAQ